MIADVMALAKDVDRLFRARADGRQMPQGFGSRTDATLTSDASEAAAYAIIGTLEGKETSARVRSITTFRDAQDRLQVFRSPRRHLRTRRHVAALALTQPEHFLWCLAEVDARPYTVEIVKSIRRDVETGPLCTPLSDADIQRTARYLQDLDARLTPYREAEARQAAIEAGRLADAEQPPTEAEPMDREDEDALMEIA